MDDNARQFGEIIKKLRKLRGFTIYLLSELSQVDKGHLSRIERGLRNPPKPDGVRRLANALGVDIEYLMAKAGYADFNGDEALADEEIIKEVASSAPFQSKAISREYLEGLKEKFPDFRDFIEFVTGRTRKIPGLPGANRSVPIVGYISAGGPVGYHSLDTDENVVLPSGELPGDPNLFAVRVKGESMIGSRIEENDVVVISPAQKALLKAGDIAAIRVGEEGITLKEVHNYEDGLVLRSSNPEFPDLKFDEADIVGKAIRLIKVQSL